MILVDANLLVYSHIASVPQYGPARAWLQHRLNGTERVGLPWPALLAFVRLTSSPRIFSPPVSVQDAWAKVEEWLALPAVWIPAPGVHHAAILAPILRREVSSAKQVPDAHLAALAIEHGLTLCTADRGFARFSGLRLEYPLADAG